LISEVTVAEFESTMITRICKGGEFYEKRTERYSTVCAKQWNSSAKQLRSIGEDSSMPVDVAARIAVHPGVFFCPLSSSPCTVLLRYEHMPALFTEKFA